MNEIGKNLQFEKYEIVDVSNQRVKTRDADSREVDIETDDIKEVRLVGVKNNSGYCGTMDWGMGNPTFLLPTNFFYNIISFFKRKGDVVHIKVDLNNGKEIILLGNKEQYNRLKRLLK